MVSTLQGVNAGLDLHFLYNWCTHTFDSVPAGEVRVSS